MASIEDVIETDVIVVGAGISGLATIKCLKDDGFKVVALERTGEVGGLWTFREDDYGVMRFTHINVSKYNYCFSDYPFPEDTPDFPHHSDMAKYIRDYTEHFRLYDDIRFHRTVIGIQRQGEFWRVTVRNQSPQNEEEVEEKNEIYQSRYVAIASGHHAEPTVAKFPGQDTFPGEIIHSVKYKDAVTNAVEGRRVLVVGIGNSAVDVATNCASEGRCKSVYMSTRSGSWIIPNYMFGLPTDLYACRVFLRYVPWNIANIIIENIIKFISGDPKKWKLNPKMQALQTQPTVSPTLIHLLQRQTIKMVPNIQKIAGSTVHFVNGESAEFDNIILCTGYKIDLPFLDKELKSQILEEDKNIIKLFKNTFSPDIGHTLGFIGFIQPASGGLLSMAETQARWFTELCRGRVSLPTKSEMREDIQEERRMLQSRYYQSARHTIQRDPILFNDEIAAYFGAKPELMTNPTLAWRLLVGSCGAAQWRLQGPGSWSKAKDTVLKVPVSGMMHYSLLIALILMGIVLMWGWSVLKFIFT